MKFYVLFLCFFCGQIFFIQAQSIRLESVEQVLKLEKKNTFLQLKHSKLPIIEDITGNLTIEEILKPDFSPKFVLREFDKDNLQPYTTYWARLKLENTSNVDEDWMLLLGKVTNIEVFLLQHTGKYDKKKTGQFVKTSEKEIKTGRYNAVEVFMPAKSGVVNIYIKFQNQIEFSPDLNLQIVPKSYWQENIILGNLLQGFFQGLLWMMLFYNFILLFVLADKTYLYYVLYIFTTSLYFLNFYGYTSEFLLGEFPYFDYVFMPFMAHIGFIAYMFFMRSYLQTKKEMPLWDTFIKIVTAIFTALLIALIALAHFNYAMYMTIERIFYGSIQGILVIMLIFILTMGEKPARYFAFGTLLMIAGGLLLFLGASKIIILHNNIIFYQAGVIGQIFVFSLGLTERYRKTEDDKHEAERRLIIQLQENDKLHTRVTTELEEKVKERTKEIERKNDEILAQSKEIEQQKNDILKKSEQVAHINQEIKHSINYASRIQTALFNDINEIEKSFREAFVFLRAKDIVSGDFYWYTEIPKNSKTTKKLNIQNQATILPQDSIFPYSYKKEKKITSRVIENQEFKKKIFIVADCTGHGVPGAFMTVMCYSILHETINEKGILEPDEILYELDKKVIESLRKGNSDNQVQDGMEITIMVYDEEDHTITYAAAGNPLYLIRNFDIQIYPASSHSIGFSKKIKQKIFEKQTISILEDDIFYMTTDGFQDQFGGSEKRKYMKKNMREFFLKISHLPLKEQKEKIRQELENWQGNQPQTDDILIAAVKF